MLQCSNFQMFKHLSVPMFQCSNVQIFKCSNVKFQMSIVKYQMSNVNKVKFLSERTSGVPPVILYHFNVTICAHHHDQQQHHQWTCDKGPEESVIISCIILVPSQPCGHVECSASGGIYFKEKGKNTIEKKDGSQRKFNAMHNVLFVQFVFHSTERSETCPKISWIYCH